MGGAVFVESLQNDDCGQAVFASWLMGCELGCELSFKWVLSCQDPPTFCGYINLIRGSHFLSQFVESVRVKP